MKRRNFLKLLGTAIVWSLYPRAWAAEIAKPNRSTRMLVLLELKGQEF